MKRKPNKPSLNLSLDREARRIAVEIKQADNRPSLVNVLENLIYEEAIRRGIKRKKVAA